MDWMAIVTIVLGVLGTLLARWSETNPDNALWVRVARVFDMTQVIDSTRKLGDE